VVPIVTILVQKARTQASVEVAEELELEEMRTYLRAFEQKARRDVEAIARLEEAEVKKFQNKEKILVERRAITASHEEVGAKVLARGICRMVCLESSR
jgi:phosphoserine phosphatase